MVEIVYIICWLILPVVVGLLFGKMLQFFFGDSLTKKP